MLKELKKCLQDKSKEIKRHEQRIEQLTINKLFQQDQQKIYQQLNGTTGNYEKPHPENSKEFWSSIRDK